MEVTPITGRKQMTELNQLEIWFITGSQHLYGDEVLKQVAANSLEIAKWLDHRDDIPVRIIHQPVVTTPEDIETTLSMAGASKQCIGVILWMHTFSPARMWINGLNLFSRPMAHLHTQFNATLPWEKIDMDFMNLNQSAHGDREFGFMASRMKRRRKVIVGHWKDEKVVKKIGTWSRVAAGWHVLQNTKVARLGDNMREVAVTEGDKVEAQMRFGFSVNGYGMGDLAQHLQDVEEQAVGKLIDEYRALYQFNSSDSKDLASLRDSARIELGLLSFLEEGGFGAFTDTFENLYGLKQLPGIAAQRLMERGYGFGAEGDWKTAALLRAIKVMDMGLEGGTSFMEDYTYDFQGEGSRVLGSHMLELCPSIASGKPRCEVHPLSIGGKEDPARLIFDVDSGPAINVSMIDLGNRFRLILNEVDVVKPEHDLPHLPVARVLWKPKPNLEISAESWIQAGGAHHTVFSKAITKEFIQDLADIAGVELLVIDEKTTTNAFFDKLRWNEVYYHLFQEKR